jgi:outer membrane protein OmpA-like peptidoglycan-associated protein
MEPVLRLLSFLMLLPLSAGAGVRHYGSSVEEATWKSENSRLSCSLTHTIPAYGKAVFVRRAGEDLAFQVALVRTPDWTGPVSLRSVAPPWKHDSPSHELGMASYDADKKMFTFESGLANVILSELEQGMFPTLGYHDASESGRDVSVSVSAVNFRPALDQFLGCTGRLLPCSFDSISKTAIPFGVGTADLSSTAQKQLDRIVAYLMMEPAVSTVLIEGHADNAGERRSNYLLSRQRAVSVRNYLVAKGLPAAEIKLRYLGDKKPIADNKTEEGRAKNRRARVRLLMQQSVGPVAANR